MKRFFPDVRLIVISTLIISVISILAYPSTRLSLGGGTGIGYPEIVSYNVKLFGELSMGEFYGIDARVRSSLELMSFLGTLLVPFDSTAVAQFDLGVDTYVGAGIGLVFLRSKFGTKITPTIHGLLGVKYPLWSRNSIIFGQIKGKTFPGTGGAIQLEVGFMQFILI